MHPDYHRPYDAPDRIDAEKESRIVRLLFYLGEEICERAGETQVEAGELQGDCGAVTA